MKKWQSGASRVCAAALAICVLLAGMVLSLAGCDRSAWRKVARASDGIAQGLEVVLNVTVEAEAHGTVTREEAIAILSHARAANLALEAFSRKAQALRKIDPKNRRLLIVWFGEAADSLNALNQEGVLAVKNPEAQAKLSIILAGIQSSAQVLAAELEGGNN